jgi:hypothetical protein
MFRELLFYCFWANLWVGFAHNLNKYSPTFHNYPYYLKNNIISFTHSILSIILAGRFLSNTQQSANVFLYEQSMSNTSLANVSHLNESLTGTGYSYTNMLEVYNHVVDPWSFILLSIQAMSVCYFAMDCFYIVNYGLIYKKMPYLFHHVSTLLLHYYAYTSDNTYEYIWLFYYGELSNCFTYITYHYVKTKNDTMAYVSSLFQCVWFAIYRVLVYSSFLLPFFNVIDSVLMRILLPCIYAMGLMWGYNLWKTTYESVETRGHLELVINELQNTHKYLQNTFESLWAKYNTSVNRVNEDKAETTTETTPETTVTTTSETTPETTTEDTHESVGTFTLDPLDDDHSTSKASVGGKIDLWMVHADTLRQRTTIIYD